MYTGLPPSITGRKSLSSNGALSIWDSKGGQCKQNKAFFTFLTSEASLSSFVINSSSEHSRGLFHGVGFDHPRQAASCSESKLTTDSSAKVQ